MSQEAWGTTLLSLAALELPMVSFLFGLGLATTVGGSARARRGHLRRPCTSNTLNNSIERHTSQPGPFLRLPGHQHSSRKASPWGSRRTAAAMGKPPLTTRRRYHIALGAARQLFAGGDISASGCGALKNHILDDDGRVAAAVEIYWLNDDGDALRATLRALGGPSWTPETERRINDHYAAYQESVRAHNEAYRHRPEVWAAATYEATGG